MSNNNGASFPCRHQMTRRSMHPKDVVKSESTGKEKMCDSDDPVSHQTKKKKRSSSQNSNMSVKHEKTSVKSSLKSKRRKRSTPATKSEFIRNEKDVPSLVNSILSQYINPEEKISNTSCNPYTTKGNWCLSKGLEHIISMEPKFLPLIQKHGPPSFYLPDQAIDESTNCMTAQSKNPNVSMNSSSHKSEQSFQPLCRIIVGQQLGGAAAMSIWNRFVNTVETYYDNEKEEKATIKEDDKVPKIKNKLSPSMLLKMIDNGDDWDLVETVLRKPVGLSKAKARSVIDLAKCYERGDLSDDLLLYNLKPSSSLSSSSSSPSSSSSFSLNSESSMEQIRSRLLKVKGIGPWTCDMFLIFHSHCSNVLPIGDLGIRKGTGLFFSVKGKGKNGVLCDKKDADLIKKLHEPFEPYRSLSSFYMWKCADTVDFSHDDS